MDNEEDVIRDQMEERRTSLSEKLEKLEGKVSGTVTDTTDAVSESVVAVKETVQETTQAVTESVAKVKEVVQDTVESVKTGVKDSVKFVRDLFDPRVHPFFAVGTATVAGVVLGRLLFPSRPHSAPRLAPTLTPEPPAMSRSQRAAGHNGNGARTAKESSKTWVQSIIDQYEPEIARMKGLAMGVAIDSLRDFVMNMAPANWKEQVHHIFQGAISKFQGQADGEESPSNSEETYGSEHEHGNGASHELSESETRLGKERSRHRRSR